MTAEAPRYARQKAEAIVSFLRFAHGLSLPAWPAEIYLETSNVCNMRCAMCGVFSGLLPVHRAASAASGRSFLDPALLDRMAPLLEHALSVHVHGYGEPLLHPEFLRIIETLRSYETVTDFFTNGMLLTPELSAALVDNQVFQITVSFSGTDAQAYENMYLGGSYDKVLGNIRALRDIKAKKGSRLPRVSVNSIGFRHHLARIEAFVDLMAESGVENVILSPLNVSEAIPELADCFVSLDLELAERLSRAREKAQERGVTLNTICFERGAAARPKDAPLLAEASGDLAGVAAFKRLAAERRGRAETVEADSAGRIMIGPDDPFVPGHSTPCMEPLKTLYVFSDGDVRSCCFSDLAYRAGSMDEATGHDAWSGPGMRLMRERALNNSYHQGMCRECLRYTNYPMHHCLHQVIINYNDWFREVHGGEFVKHLAVEQLLIKSEDILTKWKIMQAQLRHARSRRSSPGEPGWPGRGEGAASGDRT